MFKLQRNIVALCHFRPIGLLICSLESHILKYFKTH